MAIFARRDIQERLDSLTSILGKKRIRRIVRDLNIQGNESNEKRFLESISFTWEIAIISAFSELGNTKSEKKISNGRRPDFFFEDHGISLIGDVFTVSDENQHEKNPVDEFSSILQRIWSESGPDSGCYSVHIGDIDLPPGPLPRAPVLGKTAHLGSPRWDQTQPGTVKRLTLPPKNELKDYLNVEVLPFFEKLRVHPNKPDRLDIDEKNTQDEHIRFSIKYNPKGKTSFINNAAYTTMTDVERHILYRRLIEKREQFAKATEVFPRILFVCDGGCRALKNYGGGQTSYFEEAFYRFWAKPEKFKNGSWSWITEEDISGAVILSIEPTDLLYGGRNQNEFQLKAYLMLNPYCKFPLSERGEELLWNVVQKIPQPIESPTNVLNTNRVNPISTQRKKVFTMKHNETHEIEMSAIEMLRILAGEISAEEFCDNYWFDSKNPFMERLSQFQTIKSIRMAPSKDRDDDKIIIEFNTYDAAIGPFHSDNQR